VSVAKTPSARNPSIIQVVVVRNNSVHPDPYPK
jgi:hypothetical protein